MSKVDHVIFVIHGMGRQIEGWNGNYDRNLKDLNQTCKEILAEEFADTETNIKWIPIEWHKELHELETAGGRIQDITLPTCKLLRDICNDILSDVLFYFTSFHGQTLLNIVAKEINAAYAVFKDENPDFHGKISIYSHSLGSIIVYDLLAHQNLAGKAQKPKFPQTSTHFEIVYPKLDVIPDFQFSFGAPLAAVIVMRGQSFSEYQLQSTRFFNIFNLHDPLAYRLEPLLDPKFMELSPIQLERPGSKSSFQFQYYRELISAYLPDISSFNPISNIPSIPGFNPTVLQDTQPWQFPKLPKMPILSSVQESFSNHFAYLMESFWGTEPHGKRKQQDDDEHPTKRQLLGVENGHFERTELGKEEGSQKSIHHYNFSPNVKRVFKRPHSQKGKKRSSFSISKETNAAQSTIFSQISRMFSPGMMEPESKFREELKNQVDKFGEHLTRDLVAAAKKSEDAFESESDNRSESETDNEEGKRKYPRYDYYVSDSVMDNIVHQYMTGLRAHFSYWKDKNAMYFLIKNLKR